MGNTMPTIHRKYHKFYQIFIHTKAKRDIKIIFYKLKLAYELTVRIEFPIVIYIF